MARRRPLVAATVVCFIATGCASPGDTHQRAHDVARGEQQRTASATTEGHQTVASSAGPAVELRSALEMLLGDHMLLMVELMRQRIIGAGPRTRATLDSVQQNADDLAAAVRQVYGEQTAARFEELWTFHVKRLFDYSAAVAGNDEEAKQSTRAELRSLERDLGAFLAAATGGAASEHATQSALAMHIDGLLAQADAFAAGDFAKAEAQEMEGFDHMVRLAETLASAIAKSKHLPVAELASPRRTLQSALARLLSAHMGLMIEAMRGGVDNAPELRATETVVNSNSTSVAEAVATLYGRSAGQRFLDLWAEHVDALVAYGIAAGRHDAAGREAQRTALGHVATKLAEFLATATQQNLPAVQLTAALGMHDEDLMKQTDAYAAGDFAPAAVAALEGYRHMFDLAQTLADAIGDTVAARLPHGGVQTGGGGTARR